MTPSKILFYFSISFIVGIGLASLIKIPHIFLWGFLMLGSIMIFIHFLLAPTPKLNFGVGGFCILFVVLGILRFQISEFNIENDKLSKLNDRQEKITLVGQIIEEPDIRNSVQRLKFRPENTNSIVLITLGRYPEYQYLDTIKITGNLKTPVVLEDFNYKNYLMKDGIYSVMDFPKTEIVSKMHTHTLFTFFYENMLLVKEKIKDSINLSFSRPQSFIMEGIILGNDKNMPVDLKNKFNANGLSHITAVSGSNIVILLSLMVPLFLLLGLWRGQAFYISLIFIWTYIILVGLPASGVRAGIMGSLFLLAEILGRQSSGSRIITMAATVMLLQNPLLLLYDIGFQLSFLASMGIIHLKPILDLCFKLHNIPEKPKIKNSIYTKINYLLDTISVTLAAQLSVLPIIVYNFGTISLSAPITNLLILPIIPWLTISGFASAILGIFSHFLGWVFWLPCWILLTYLLKVMDIFYTLWGVVVIRNISLFWIVIYYIIYSILIWYLNKKLKYKFLGY